MELQEMIDLTPINTILEYEAEAPTCPKPGRFYEVGPSYLYPQGLFAWTSRPKGCPKPSTGNLNRPRVDLDGFQPFLFRFHGSEHEMPDLYKYGDMFAVSGKLFHVISSLDPSGIEHAHAKMIADDAELDWYVILPTRLIFAPDIKRNSLTVAKRRATVGSLVEVTAPRKFYFRSDIDESVHLFRDLSEPRNYWSMDLLHACQDSGVQGIYASDGYAPEPRLMEL